MNILERSDNIITTLEQFLNQQWLLLNDNADTDIIHKTIAGNLEEFWKHYQNDIVAYAITLEKPKPDTEINYLRHQICGGDNFVAMIHVFNPFAYTKIHNHGGNGIFAIPLTTQLEVQNYSKLNMLDDGQIQVLQPLKQTLLRQYSVFTHNHKDGHLVHKLGSVGSDHQMILEIYLPKCGECDAYLPIHNKKNQYYYSTQATLNKDSHMEIMQNSLSTISDDVFTQVNKLLEQQDSGYDWPIYLSNHEVIVDKFGLLDYLESVKHQGTHIAIAYLSANLRKIAIEPTIL